MSDVTMTSSRELEFEVLYREQGARLWRALYAFTGNRDVASDALGEAFAQALSRGEARRSTIGQHGSGAWPSQLREEN